MLTLGSLFDGIGGWLLAAKHAGVTPVWASEIDDFPAAVTAHHFPSVKQLGDITKIDVLEPVDIICAGSPCQDLSVAGKRAGLAGERSGLFVRAVDIVRQMRRATDGEKPRFFVWENVPGAFSSNHRRDFQAVLEEIGQAEVPMPKSGRWADAGLVRTHACDIAWRVLDAQYWGVPQRRKRIFLVADFAADDRCAAEILFEPEGVQGVTPQGEGTRKGTTARPSGSLGETGGSSDSLTPWMPKGVRVQSEDGVSVTLSTDGKTSVLQRGGRRMGVYSNTVRRLTPLEYERLQGLPDGYTDVEFKGKPAPDSRRYKALGNGMAQPCADFVIGRIVESGKKGIDNTPPDVI